MLALETSTKVCSVALWNQGDLVAYKESDDQEYDHAEKLNPFIVELLEEQGLRVPDLAAVAVSRGPGSYTGLRIGVASAKGLCYSTGLPLISVCPLQAMLEMVKQERNGLNSDCTYHAYLDARRREVFASSYNGFGEEISSVDAIVLDENEPIFKQQHQLFFGPGADKFESEIPTDNLIKGIYPSARYMGGIAFRKFENQDFADLAYFEPFYLKDFIAIKAKPKFNRRNT
ncbi:tRNA (adenosine(37)-N6)-threonylcarbamoyltransferase complex dimerization subunit type 1 TsaB [Luteibaculum oceani]|uniref:tRNA (Adenosine(37)-N6)-threonylcarbamoyltransferase complex dimerization subunit type 1 TsaB n=1 Tax=Luteibaculum oceani TaxID=1294296 RepID=A0A5C6URL9_9FLAO|nr:tRNA (adenosine(37)-N6)-threonylcarbamoyltransferase complex dimerization subunit type 1 TsaB [Luteibaculum oceani]